MYSPKAGVYAGTIAEKEKDEVRLTDVRMLWYYSGAASLPQLAMEGVKNPRDCKFTVTVPEVVILEVCEIFPCTEAAEANIKDVPEWKK